MKVDFIGQKNRILDRNVKLYCKKILPLLLQYQLDSIADLVECQNVVIIRNFFALDFIPNSVMRRFVFGKNIHRLVNSFWGQAVYPL